MESASHSHRLLSLISYRCVTPKVSERKRSRDTRTIQNVIIQTRSLADLRSYRRSCREWERRNQVYIDTLPLQNYSNPIGRQTPEKQSMPLLLLLNKQSRRSHFVSSATIRSELCPRDVTHFVPTKGWFKWSRKSLWYLLALFLDWIHMRHPDIPQYENKSLSIPHYRISMAWPA